MKFKILLGILLATCLSVTLMSPILVSAADQLLRKDFEGESFSKVVDYFDYARALAVVNGLPRPQNYWHAYVYMTYVNKMGFQMLYAGLSNISLADQAYLTIPMQTILMHYKTATSNRDALVASSFVMLMGFNDTAESIYPDSPDRNDTLWASFSFGFNLAQVFPNATFPAFNSKSEIFPLTASADGLTWKWGMRYTNLTALWITTSITDENETDTSRPFGLVTYDELTFNYTLTIDPNTRKATISQDYAIGRMRDLWVFWGWFIIPFYNHYNSTGTYSYGQKLSDETIYQFLEKNDVKMSIADFQTSIMLDRKTYSLSNTEQNVTDNEVDVSDSSISTYTEDGEKIFEAGFGGVKETYKLYNYTEDSTETTADVYAAVTKTVQIDGYARNKNLFAFHANFARYLPLILVHMYPQLYQRAKDTITNMTRADYLYLVSYPTYSGYRVEHDPTYTAYFAPITSVVPPNLGGLIAVAAIVGGIILIAVVILKRRTRPKELSLLPTEPSSPSSPPPPPA